MNLVLLKLTTALVVAHLARPLTAQTARSLTDAEVREALGAHNQARSETAQAQGVENMPELVWNASIANIGLTYAQSSGCRFAHNPNRQGTGENLAAGQQSWHAAIYNSWYKSEESLYFNNQGGAGHYTQVTWANTVQLGCAYCDRSSNGLPNYYICNYYPPGNYIGQSPWQPGSGACQSCPSSRPGCTSNPHPGLCTANVQGTTSQQPATTTTQQPATTTSQQPATTTSQQPATTTQQPATTTTTQQPATTTTTQQPATTTTTQQPVATTTTAGSATDPPAPNGARFLTSEEAAEALRAHNLARAETAREQGVPDMPEMVWSNDISRIGFEYFRDNNCQFAHNPNRNGTGENLALGYRSWHAAIYEGWYESEEAAYLQNTGGVTGHYTQVTWRDSTQVGCAFCSSNNRVYVCNYSPPGNFIGRSPWTGGSTPCSRCPSGLVCGTGEYQGLCVAPGGPTQPTQPGQTTTQQTQPPQTTTNSPPTSTAEPDMMLEFTLRMDYNSIQNFDALEANLKRQLELYYGLPQDRTDLDFEDAGFGRTRVIVTVYGAQFSDDPLASSMVSSLMVDDGAQLGASDVHCVQNCGGQPATNSGPSGAEGTSVGLLAGIAVAVVLVLAIAGVGGYWYLRRRREKHYLDNMASDTQMTVAGDIRGGAM